LLPVVLLFGLVVAPLLAYFGLFSGTLDPAPSTKLGRLHAGATRNAITFVACTWGYFTVLLFCLWIGFVAPWRAMRMLRPG